MLGLSESTQPLRSDLCGVGRISEFLLRSAEALSAEETCQPGGVPSVSRIPTVQVIKGRLCFVGKLHPHTPLSLSHFETLPLVEMSSAPVAKDVWSSSAYNKNASFVYSTAFSTPVLELLNAQPGERILDLGCQ